MSGSSAYRRSPTALWRRVGDQVLLADAEGAEVHALSATASATWLLLDGPRTREALVAALASGFGGEPTEVAGNVDRLLERLEVEGWVFRTVGDV